MDKTVSQEYISSICALYNEAYDDRVEDTCPPVAGGGPGKDWTPGKRAEHKSLAAFQGELRERGIELSTTKIKKILISGGCWTTRRSRSVQELYSRYTSQGLPGDAAVKRVAEELGISRACVSVNLPYATVVYNLEDRSGNALRCARYRARAKETPAAFGETLRGLDQESAEQLLWEKIAALQGETLRTSGRYGSGGVEFTYTVRRDKKGGWRGELFISTKEKSITRATVMAAYRKAVELNGDVPGPKKLGTFGASYLYSIFQKLGIIKG